MSGMYTVEAVRDLQAMYPYDTLVHEGEVLSLILDSGKLCLVHRKDDLPFVVPKPYIVHKEVEDGRRTGSFSKFLKERKYSRRRNHKYPMSSYNLECVHPQFASVTWSSSATSLSEVSLEKDTAVLILDADPQSLFWYGVTQSGRYGLMSRHHVSFITQRGTPSLQKGCHLTTFTRMAHTAEEPDELSVEKGSYLEVIGMPELWRWQVRLPQGDRTIGLLPIHVLSEVSVICSPEAEHGSHKAHPALKDQTPRVPTMLSSEETQLIETAGRQATLRRQRRDPLPARPDSSTYGLNDLNRPPRDQHHDYVNNFHLFGEFSESDPPRSLCSDEHSRPQELEGLSRHQDESRHTYAPLGSPVRRADDAIDKMRSLLEVLDRDRQSLKRSNMDLEAHVEKQARHFQRAAEAFSRIAKETRNISESLYHLPTWSIGTEDQMPYDEGWPGGGHDGVPYGYMNCFHGVGDHSASLRGNPHPVRRSSVTGGSLQISGHNARGGLGVRGGAVPKKLLPRSESQPMLDRCPWEEPVAVEQDRDDLTGYFHDMSQLDSAEIEVIMMCTCPAADKRPLVHWKPVLVNLGLKLESAQKITKGKLNAGEEWRLALRTWRSEVGRYATMHAFLEELKRTGRFDIYSAIVKQSSFRMKEKLYWSVESFV